MISHRGVTGAAVAPRYCSHPIARGRPVHAWTGPDPLPPIDDDLDFDAKYHHDQKQENKMARHLITS